MSDAKCSYSSLIPKSIWTFWDSDDIPPLIIKCIDSWKELNPDYNVTLITRKNLIEHVGNKESHKIQNWKYNDSPQRFAQLVKLEVLYQHGGIWLDASTVLYEPLGWVHTYGKETVIFSILERTREPLLDSWFIATTKNNPFIKEWNEEHRRIATFSSLKEFIANVEPTLLLGIDKPENYIMYIVGRWSNRKHSENIKVLSTSDGPMHYLTMGGVKYLCEEKKSFAKFRREERLEIINNPDLEECVFGRSVIHREKEITEDYIPKIIWTFWQSFEIPGLIEKCVSTWKTLNPNYVVHVVTSANLSKYIGEEQSKSILQWKYNLSPQHLSHLVRLEILSQYGGIWLDASTAVYEPFAWVHKLNRPTVLFSILEKSSEPLIDNWFIATSRNNDFIKEWRTEYQSLALFDSLKEYINTVDRSLLEGIENPEQSVMYIISRKFYRKHRQNIKLLSSSVGPLKYLLNGGLEYLCKEKKSFAKLRREERRLIFENPELKECVFGLSDAKAEVNKDIQIPQEIWTFWDSDDIPEIIEKSISTWKNSNPSYSINLVTKSSLANFIGEDEAKKILNWKHLDSPQRLSNLIRLELLERYGGIWLDASMLVYESLDWINSWGNKNNMLIENGGCIIYSIKERSYEPLLDNWFIACPKAHPFIIDWNKEHRKVEEYESIRNYLMLVEPTLLIGINNPEYFLMYVISRWSYRRHQDEIRIMSTSDGPMKYMISGGLKSLCEHKPTMAKLRREERTEIENNPTLEKCLFGKE